MKMWLQNQIILTKTQQRRHTDNNDSSTLDKVCVVYSKRFLPYNNALQILINFETMGVPVHNR